MTDQQIRYRNWNRRASCDRCDWTELERRLVKNATDGNRYGMRNVVEAMAARKSISPRTMANQIQAVAAVLLAGRIAA